ncbi:hypothetical protein Calhy_0776 [Caldicellulosiruptor hydrothermalis 108]|uniref:Uncharacterized protein n=1 Tax=Caldicellulosiruptor hydrothermalis (strain DSM 18901 / VKM B-2411 / 108) TaxID=632292 RepID=E4QE19_CALH1|nr:hypothetical protein [Caldicellulosiruptor hydrothermalis]ADQ06513.1 hypothetical protein Calhy_0776 [Caldicellulosiruptor hydrothermalis 108]
MRIAIFVLGLLGSLLGLLVNLAYVSDYSLSWIGIIAYVCSIIATSLALQKPKDAYWFMIVFGIVGLLFSPFGEVSIVASALVIIGGIIGKIITRKERTDELQISLFSVFKSWWDAGRKDYKCEYREERLKEETIDRDKTEE